MSYFNLIKGTSYLALTRVFEFLSGLVRTKLIAHYLGTFGTGLISQLNFITQRMSQFTLLSMSEGLVKLIAENKESKQLVQSAYKIYILLMCLFLTLSISLAYGFSNELTIYTLGDIEFLGYFYVGLLSFPILVLDSIPFSILKSFNDYKSISQSRIISVSSTLLISIPLIYYFRLKGAVILVPFSYSLTLFTNLYFAKKYHFKDLGLSIKSLLNTNINYQFGEELLKFSIFGITIGSYSIVSELVCRSILIEHNGVNSIGIYSPILLFASSITGFILPAFSTFLYPKFCEIKNNEETSKLINQSLRLSTFLLFPLLLLVIPYRAFLIKLFFSSQFQEASDFLPYHFIGTTFYVWWYVFSQAMTPNNKIKQHGLFLFFYFSIDIIITIILVPQLGLWGWTIKHVLSPILFFGIYLLFLNIELSVKLQKENLYLMLQLILSTFVLLGTEKFLPRGNKITYILGPLLLLFAWFQIKKEEKLKLYSNLNKILRKYTR